jgi:phenylpropionate dioxygenase-like ring-hydroxylating dioxygenase large terminal subunit
MSDRSVRLIENKCLEDYWYAVALSEDVVDGPLLVKLLDSNYVIWRDLTGSLVAASELCPHRQMPLSEGHIQKGCLICPYHGWVFGEKGQCKEIPSSNADVPVPPKAHLSTFETTERYGIIWLSPGKPKNPLFAIPQEEDPSFRRINTEIQSWKVAATRMVDNFLDITHFPFVHVGTFGSAQEKEVPAIKLESLDNDFFGYAYDVLAANPSEARSSSGTEEATVSRSMTTGFNLPFAVRSTIAYESGLHHIILLISTPIDETNSYFTFVVWRNDDFEISGEEVIAFDRAIGEEDRIMLEKLNGPLPLGQTDLANVRADKASVEWRRQLNELLNK